MERINSRNFAHSELASTAITKNPTTNAGYRDESLTNADIQTGNIYGTLVNFAKIINQYRLLVGRAIQSINNAELIPWSANISYSDGAVVVYGGGVYISNTTSNLGNLPDSSGQWDGITDFLENEFVRVDLSNVVVSGNGNTIVLQSEPQLINPDVTTQPPGTDSTKAASCAFVQAAIGQAPSDYYAAPLPQIYVNFLQNVLNFRQTAAKVFPNQNLAFNDDFEQPDCWGRLDADSAISYLALPFLSGNGETSAYVFAGTGADNLKIGIFDFPTDTPPQIGGVFDTSENPLMMRQGGTGNPPEPLVGGESLMLLTTGENFD